MRAADREWEIPAQDWTKEDLQYWADVGEIYHGRAVGDLDIIRVALQDFHIYRSEKFGDSDPKDFYLYDYNTDRLNERCVSVKKSKVRTFLAFIDYRYQNLKQHKYIRKPEDFKIKVRVTYEYFQPLIQHMNSGSSDEQ